MSKRSILFVSLFSITVIIAVALPFYAVHAVSWLPLVPCGTSTTQPCQFCDFFKLIDNVKNFLLVDILTPVGVLFIVYAGILILTGGYKPGNIAQGKKVLTDTILGIFIIFSAWMITNTILQLFTGDSNVSRNWYSISCNVTEGTTVGGPTPVPTNPGGPTPIPTTPSTGGTSLTCSGSGTTIKGKYQTRTAICTDCKTIKYGLTRIQERGGTKVDQAAASLADFLNNKFSPAMLAAGIPPLYYNNGFCPNSFIHVSPAHYNGHAMDVNFTKRTTAQKEQICQILNQLGVKRYGPGEPAPYNNFPASRVGGYSHGGYIVETGSPRNTNPNSACPRNTANAGSGLHMEY